MGIVGKSANPAGDKGLVIRHLLSGGQLEPRVKLYGLALIGFDHFVLPQLVSVVWKAMDLHNILQGLIAIRHPDSS